MPAEGPHLSPREQRERRGLIGRTCLRRTNKLGLVRRPSQKPRSTLRVNRSREAITRPLSQRHRRVSNGNGSPGERMGTRSRDAISLWLTLSQARHVPARNVPQRRSTFRASVPHWLSPGLCHGLCLHAKVGSRWHADDARLDGIGFPCQR